MTALPPLTPVTVAFDDDTLSVAIAVLELLHVPPTAACNVVVVASQNDVVPVIAVAAAFTVIALVAPDPQPVL